MKMRTVRQALVASLLAAPLLAQAQAQTPAPAPAAPTAPAPAPVPVSPEMRNAVRDLFDAMNTRDGLTKAFGQFAQSLPQRIYEAVIQTLETNQTLTAEQKQGIVANIRPQFENAVKEAQGVVTDPKMVQDTMDKMIPIYARQFTLQEIKELTAFYRSPVGAKAQTVLPAANAEAFAQENTYFGPRVSGIVDRLMKQQIDAAAAGGTAPATKAPASTKAPAKKSP
jgi:hypothetical protein